MLRPSVILALVFSVAGAGCGPGAGVPPDALPTPTVRILVDEVPEDDVDGYVDATAALPGDPWTVVVEGAVPGEELTVIASSSGLSAQAKLVAADDGSIDLRRDAPVEGTWTGVEPEGLSWSAVGAPDPDADPSVEVSLLRGATVVARATLDRVPVTELVVIEEIAEGRTVGLLATPPPEAGDGPFPAMLLFGGSEGGTGGGVSYAPYLASLGVVALGIGYFAVPDVDGVPAIAHEIPLEILEEALAFLTSVPRVDPEHIGVAGASLGGELAMVLAARLPVVKGAVAVSPSGVVFGAFSNGNRSHWTDDGEAVPFVPLLQVPPAIVSTDDDGAQHLSMRNRTDESLAAASPEVIEAATSHVENMEGALLVLAGEDDQRWNACDLAALAFARLDETHLSTFGDELSCFPGAGHIMAFGGAPVAGTVEEPIPNTRNFLLLGGDVASNAHAGRAADNALRRFLARL